MLAPILEPDADAMLRHLQAVFGGAGDGLVELAWTDPETRRLAHAQMFATDRLHELAERAAALNRTPNCNVYIGAALRQPTASPNRRGSDADFNAATCAWADVDEDVVNEAVARCRAAGLMPNLTVVTGRRPHVRAQLWWRLDAPCNEPAELRTLNGALASALGGDPTVVNPGRVLRLGGSVAWPAKPGRSLERTEVHVPQDGRPPRYPAARITEAFGSRAPLLSAEAAPAPHTEPKPAQTGEDPVRLVARPPASASPAPTDLAIGSNVSVEGCIARIRAGDHWHDNLVRLTGHWIARGWSDAEILTAAEALTLPGYTVAQTRREVAAMIAGGRQKWALPNPAHEIETAEPAPFVLRPLGLLDPSKRPPRNWLVRHRLMRKHTTVTAAAPGVGKSTLTIEEAVSLASGMDFLGFGIDRPRKVALINNEETQDEMERRIEATCTRFEVPFAAIAETLYLHSGVDAEKLVVAQRGPNETVVVQPRARQLSAFLREVGIDLLVLDPFVQLHTVSENVNEEIEQVMMALREISVAADCALHLVHHTRKPPAGSAHQAGDIFAVRGGGAIVGDAHFVFTLADMGQADAESLGVMQADRNRFVRLDDAKGKLAPPSGARWFEREGIAMPYGLIGEEIGVLVPRSFEEERSGPTTAAVVQILKEIDARWREGNPFSAAPQSPRYVVPMMVQSHGLSPRAARQLLRDWIANGMVASAAYDNHSKGQGLKVLAWPG